MITLSFITAILFPGSILAGFLGSLSGLGGGLVIIPLLILGLNVDIHYAIGTSLIAVIATSTASSCAYIKEGYTNIKIGIFLETATTIGALLGVFISAFFSDYSLKMIFGLFLIYTAISSVLRKFQDSPTYSSDKVAKILQLYGTYPIKGRDKVFYSAHRVLLGYSIMFFGGAISGLLGLGAGVVKVLALDKVMGLPFKVSTTTSNFMIGVTAATSASLYLKLGYIDPILTMPVVLGVAIGSLFGAKILPHTDIKILRMLFTVLVTFLGLQMILGA